MKFTQGYFYQPDGRQFYPLGIFANYFSSDLVGVRSGAQSQHGDNLIEFQRATEDVWRRLFERLGAEGYTAIRLFPRGDSGGSAWEGLDIGGRVNHALLASMLRYIEVAGEYGIKTQLCLFTEMECSFYCEPMTRRYWGTRLYTRKEIEAAPAFQRRFLENPDDMVDYNDYFTDRDVIACNKQFLDEILPLVKDNENILMVELLNEYGWASPHAKPANTLRWELNRAYIAWAREMVEHIHLRAPGLPVALSNPGFGLLGHDPVEWMREIGPDVFSIHLYGDICGNNPGTDYAQIADAVLRYTRLAGPAMYGEWELLNANGPFTRRDKQLFARDMAWLTMLSGAPGCIAWLGQGYGEYALVREVFAQMDGHLPAADTAPLKIDVRDMADRMATLAAGGVAGCRMTQARWCPDAGATDGLHRYCVKLESPEYKKLLSVETWSLQTGVDYALTLDGTGMPLMEVARGDFEAAVPPVFAGEGYQMRRMSLDGGKALLVYLRNYVRRPVMQSGDAGEFELFAIRGQAEVDLTVQFALDAPYALRIFDLDKGAWLPEHTVHDGQLALGRTSHDYALLLVRKP